MARKSSVKKGGSRPRTKPFKKSDGKLNKWNTISDIPLDEEDQFYASRDKILLDDPYGSRDHPDDEDDDEVFALKGLDDDSDDDEEFYEDDGDEEIEEPLQAASEPKKSKKSKAKRKTDDEEKEEDEEEESWGKGKTAYYSSNADQLESDDEEGHELEEQESRRLQIKARQELQDEDFGLNDNPELEKKDNPLDLDEPEPASTVELPKERQALLRHLEKTNPEALALANDWDDTVYNLEKTKAYLMKLEKEDPDSMSLGMIHIYYQALLSYSTMLAFFLHLRASSKYAQKPALLQSHPIMQRLLTLKQSLQTMEDLDFAIPDSDDSDDESDDEGSYGEYMDMSMEEMLQDGENVWRLDAEKGLEPNELAELLEDAEGDFDLKEPQITKRPKKKRKVAKSTEENTSSPSTVSLIFDLVEPEFVSVKASSSRHHPAQDLGDPYGEATSLHSVDAADKTARKKSLRFHTSKIESASARRQGARNQAVGGDDDIPYRERKNEKDARLVKEAARRASQQGGEDLDPEGGPSEHQIGDKRPRDNDDGDGDESPDDYYELVKKKSKEKKEKKKAEYEEEHGRIRVDEEEGASGPRSLTRAILTNKGLTPHRPKVVRNPRVKKRQKYEKAKKKVSSQKAVYKGGLSESKGRYDGERSGITKVIKSVKLG
ncbi:Sas10 C-terminal domain-containing protein [Panaeolus papilionaceus]|nr:Sas10 C-terminal domain-containing protein [Panaeolus papilionaceus]